MIPTKIRVIETGEIYGIQEIHPLHRTVNVIRSTNPITYRLYDFNEIKFIMDWVACSNILPNPERGRVRVLYDDFTIDIVGAEFLRAHWFSERITHWMPLPDGPKD